MEGNKQHRFPDNVITPKYVHILAYLHEYGALYKSELGRMLNFKATSSQTNHPLIEEMIQRGIIKSEKVGRVVMLSLSTKGETLGKKAYEFLEEYTRVMGVE